MSDLSCTFDEFKHRIKFAIDQHRTGTLKEEERDQLVKMVNLSYLNLSDFEYPLVKTSAPLALQIFHREMGLVPPLPGLPASRFFERVNELSTQADAVEEAASATPAKSSAAPTF